MEDKLHNELIEFVGMKTTFEELYYHINELILKEGLLILILWEIWDIRL